MATRSTKAQLMARIEECEQACAAFEREREAMQLELNALYAAQRPSRVVPTPVVPVKRGLPAHFAAARELAMRCGHAVKVG